MKWEEIDEDHAMWEWSLNEIEDKYIQVSSYCSRNHMSSCKEDYWSFREEEYCLEGNVESE